MSRRKAGPFGVPPFVFWGTNVDVNVVVDVNGDVNVVVSSYRGTASSACELTLGKIVDTENPDGFSVILSPSFPPLRSGANQYNIELKK